MAIVPAAFRSHREPSPWLPLILLVLLTGAHAAFEEPFPLGHAMQHFGAILSRGSPATRQAWLPACFLQDSARFGFSFGCVNYYAAMDNLRGRDFRRAAGGAWVGSRRWMFKGAVMFLDALGVYYEQTGFVSAGARALWNLHTSFEFYGYRAGLSANPDESETVACAGLSAWVPWTFASASFSWKNIVIKRAHGRGFDPPMTLGVGMHTAPHKFGAQGVLVVVVPDDDLRIRFLFGQEIRLCRTVFLSGGLATSPIMASMGISFWFPATGIASALVNHPLLGWSQGFGMDWAWP